MKLAPTWVYVVGSWAATVGITALILTACSPAPVPTQREKNPNPHEISQIIELDYKLENGRTVTCLLWNSGPGNEGGMSCDWINAR